MIGNIMLIYYRDLIAISSVSVRFQCPEAIDSMFLSMHLLAVYLSYRIFLASSYLVSLHFLAAALN